MGKQRITTSQILERFEALERRLGSVEVENDFSIESRLQALEQCFKDDTHRLHDIEKLIKDHAQGVQNVYDAFELLKERLDTSYDRLYTLELSDALNRLDNKIIKEAAKDFYELRLAMESIVYKMKR